MKKSLKVIVILLLIFLGIIIGMQETRVESDLERRKDAFENEIIIPGNNYKSEDYTAIDPGLFNKIGKKGENAIEKSTRIVFDFIKKIID